MKILIIAPKNKTLVNFRGDLVRSMIEAGNEVITIGPDDSFHDELAAIGVAKHYIIPLVKDNTSVSGDLRYYRNLRKVIGSIAPDMVLSYTIKPVVYGSIAAAKCGVRHIYALITGLGRVYSSGGLKGYILQKITNFLYRSAFKHTDAVMFQNSQDIDDLVRFGCVKREKTYLVNGSGVNMNRFSPMPYPDKMSFLMVGRIIAEKGVLEYCKAAERIKSEYPEATFTLLGGVDSSIGALAPEAVRDYAERSVIVYPGEVKDPVAYYGACSVFVLPSYYREGLPRTILEAMACGRPIVTTDWPGCRDPIENGVNGFLVPARDETALADAMKQFITDPDLVSRMGAESMRICRDKYDVNIVNEQMRKVMGW